MTQDTTDAVTPSESESDDRDWVFMSHPDIEGPPARVLREAHDALWAEKGWEVVADQEAAQAEAAEHEQLVSEYDSVVFTGRSETEFTKPFLEGAAAHRGVSADGTKADILAALQAAEAG